MTETALLMHDNLTETVRAAKAANLTTIPAALHPSPSASSTVETSSQASLGVLLNSFRPNHLFDAINQILLSVHTCFLIDAFDMRFYSFLGNDKTPGNICPRPSSKKQIKHLRLSRRKPKNQCRRFVALRHKHSIVALLRNGTNLLPAFCLNSVLTSKKGEKYNRE